MNNGVIHAHLGPIWYHTEPLDVPYGLFPKPVSWLGLFCRFLQQDGSRKLTHCFEFTEMLSLLD